MALSEEPTWQHQQPQEVKYPVVDNLTGTPYNVPWQVSHLPPSYNECVKSQANGNVTMTTKTSSRTHTAEKPIWEPTKQEIRRQEPIKEEIRRQEPIKQELSRLELIEQEIRRLEPKKESIQQARQQRETIEQVKENLHS